MGDGGHVSSIMALDGSQIHRGPDDFLFLRRRGWMALCSGGVARWEGRGMLGSRAEVYLYPHGYADRKVSDGIFQSIVKLPSEDTISGVIHTALAFSDPALQEKYSREKMRISERVGSI